jgi:hypothetical protein
MEKQKDKETIEELTRTPTRRRSTSTASWPGRRRGRHCRPAGASPAPGWRPAPGQHRAARYRAPDGRHFGGLVEVMRHLADSQDTAELEVGLEQEGWAQLAGLQGWWHRARMEEPGAPALCRDGLHEMLNREIDSDESSSDSSVSSGEEETRVKHRKILCDIGKVSPLPRSPPIRAAMLRLLACQASS